MSPKRIPRDVSGQQLVSALGRAYGYTVTRQTGSHLRLTTSRKGDHHVTVPAHDALRVGTLAAIVAAVAEHFGLTRDDVVETLFP